MAVGQEKRNYDFPYSFMFKRFSCRNVKVQESRRLDPDRNSLHVGILTVLRRTKHLPVLLEYASECSKNAFRSSDFQNGTICFLKLQNLSRRFVGLEAETHRWLYRFETLTSDRNSVLSEDRAMHRRVAVSKN